MGDDPRERGAYGHISFKGMTIETRFCHMGEVVWGRRN